jgi:mono/diheme cytochrome c family protein
MSKKRTAIRLAGPLAFLMGLCPVASAQDPALIDAGEALYDENCAPCHGEKLRNTGTTFDLRKLQADQRPRFNKFVMEGKGQMPSWQGTLSDKDMDALWAFIRAHAFDK